MATKRFRHDNLVQALGKEGITPKRIEPGSMAVIWVACGNGHTARWYESEGQAKFVEIRRTNEFPGRKVRSIREVVAALTDRSVKRAADALAEMATEAQT
jgi:hypothetical protein